MPITETQFNQLVIYSLRIELQNGRVLIYRINPEHRKYLINKLSAHSEGFEENSHIGYLWFETSLSRQVVVNIKEMIRVTFLIDYSNPDDFNAYYDNFEVVEKDTSIVTKETAEGDTRLYVLDEEYLPQAIVYHKGKSPEDNFDVNPLLYFSLNEGCLGTFALELDDEIPMRQFMNLTDNDGEESFIPLHQIIVMEFDKDLLYDSEKEMALENDFDLDEDVDEGSEKNQPFDQKPVLPSDIDRLFEGLNGDLFGGNPFYDDGPGEKRESKPGPDDKPGRKTEKD
jgi:hypothetical protein